MKTSRDPINSQVRLNLGKQYNLLKRHEKKKWRKLQNIPHWKAKRYAKLYREYSEKGTLYGKVPNALVLKKVRFVKNRAGKYPRAEEKLEAEFAERRRVVIQLAECGFKPE